MSVVMIIIVTAFGMGNGTGAAVAIHQVEFQSLELCEIAANNMPRLVPDRWQGNTKATYKCVKTK